MSQNVLATRLRFLVIATEWFSHNGGLSTLNRLLCVGLAKSHHQVVCVVRGPVEPKELEDAGGQGVTLVAAPVIGGKDVGALACLHLRPTLPDGFEPDVVLGHGRITGSAARTQCKYFFPSAKRVHFLHTQPGEIEWYKPRGTDAADRAEGGEGEEVELAKSAALAVGVGPRLRDEINYLLHPFPDSPPVREYLPALTGDDDPKCVPAKPSCLFIGRAEDRQLKGLDIAVAAVDYAQRNGINAQLFVRGAATGTSDSLQAELQSLLKPNSVRVRDFTADPEAIREDFLRSAVVLMPSRTEGFGLVGLEAIGWGIPVIVSAESGLGNFLLQDHPDLARNVVAKVFADDAETKDIWGRRLTDVLSNLSEAFAEASKLRAHLRPILTLERASQALVQAILSAPEAPTVPAVFSMPGVQNRKDVRLARALRASNDTFLGSAVRPLLETGTPAHKNFKVFGEDHLVDPATELPDPSTVNALVEMLVAIDFHTLCAQWVDPLGTLTSELHGFLHGFPERSEDLLSPIEQIANRGDELLEILGMRGTVASSAYRKEVEGILLLVLKSQRITRMYGPKRV